ncbi:MAG: hypothetical protein ACPGVB_14595 [Chitinophagales bacterium]
MEDKDAIFPPIQTLPVEKCSVKRIDFSTNHKISMEKSVVIAGFFAIGKSNENLVSFKKHSCI